MADESFAAMFSASIEKEINRRKTAPDKDSKYPPPVVGDNPPFCGEAPDDGGDDEHWRECVFYAANGVDKRKVKRDLSRRYAAEAEFSVREMTVAAAHRELGLFLAAAAKRGLRYVEVIHGRGRNSPGGVSPLRAKTRKWLAQSAAVLAFMEIPGNPGGVRALLRRNGAQQCG